MRWATEFTLRVPPRAKFAEAKQVYTCLAQVVTTTGKLIEVARSLVSRRYAFAAPLSSRGPEDFVALVEREAW